MIPALTTMPAMPVTVAAAGSFDAAMPGFAALLASTKPVVPESAAPQQATTPAALAPAPAMASTPVHEVPAARVISASLAGSQAAPSVMSAMPSLSQVPMTQAVDDRDADFPGRAFLPKALLAAVLEPDPRAPARPRSSPVAVVSKLPEALQRAMPSTVIAVRTPVMAEIERSSRPPQPAALGTLSSLRVAVSVSNFDVPLSGVEMAAPIVQHAPYPDTSVSVSSVHSMPMAAPLLASVAVVDTMAVADIAAAPDRASVTPVTKDTASAPDLADTVLPPPMAVALSGLSPLLIIAGTAASAPMMPQAIAAPAVTMAATTLATRPEAVATVSSVLARHHPDAPEPVLRDAISVPALGLSAAALVQRIVAGDEPIASVVVQPISFAVRLAPQLDLVPAPAAAPSIATPGETPALPSHAPIMVSVTATVAAAVSSPSAATPSIAPQPPVAAPDPASRSFVPAFVPGTMPPPALALASSSPAIAAVSPAVVAALPREATVSIRASTANAAARLPHDRDDREIAPGALTIADPVMMRAAPCVEAAGAAAMAVPAVEISTPQPVDLVVESGRLGAVRIGIEGGASDLKVSLGLSPAAAALVAADAPRLIADLAAGGVRLQSLDVSGGGTGGQPPQSHHAPASPRSAASPTNTNAPTVRPSTADRYA